MILMATVYQMPMTYVLELSTSAKAVSVITLLLICTQDTRTQSLDGEWQRRCLFTYILIILSVDDVMTWWKNGLVWIVISFLLFFCRVLTWNIFQTQAIQECWLVCSHVYTVERKAELQYTTLINLGIVRSFFARGIHFVSCNGA